MKTIKRHHRYLHFLMALGLSLTLPFVLQQILTLDHKKSLKHKTMIEGTEIVTTNATEAQATVSWISFNLESFILMSLFVFILYFVVLLMIRKITM